MAELHPVVIPPMEHKFKAVTYTCSGEGLYKDGHSYDAQAEKLLPPKVQRPGNKKDIEIKPAGWWKAQCAFRGLNQTGSIADLQSRLREAKKKMIPELKAAETQLNKDFKKQNKIARDQTWKGLKTAREKAEANPQRYLSEAFPKTAVGRSSNRDVVIVKTEDRIRLADAADKMGLESVSVDAPWVDNIRPCPDRWIVIGRSRDAVWDQMREIERAAARFRLDTPKVGGNQTPKSRASNLAVRPGSPRFEPSGGRTKQTARKTAPSTSTHENLFAGIETRPARSILPLPRKKQSARKAAPSTGTHDDYFDGSDPRTMRSVSQESRKKQTARKHTASTSTHPNLFSDDGSKQPAAKRARTSKGSSRNATESETSWDIRGSYVIECKDIEDEWGEKDSELTLDIYLENKDGKLQMFAMFDFVVVQGIMRFERPSLESRAQNRSGKRKRESSYMDDDGDVLMSDIPRYNTNNGSPDNYQDSPFFLKSNDKPSDRRSTWQYRWRGAETGDGEIELGSDRSLESITFSNKGEELSGTFQCDFAGKCEFTGTKVMSRPHGSRIDPDAEWEDRSETAFEYARWI